MKRTLCSSTAGIDRHGRCSRQCDIVIFDDAQFPKYFRKVHPIETVFAVIEVKTQLSKQQADEAFANEQSLRALDAVPELAPYWQTQTNERKIPHAPPAHCVFGYRSATEDFATFVRWFSNLPTDAPPSVTMPYRSPFNHFIACALDKGLIFCRGDSFVARWLSVAEEHDGEHNFPVLVDGQRLEVDPVKALSLFLETLWTMIDQSPRHPGFDIRAYMDLDLGSLIETDATGNVKIEGP